MNIVITGGNSGIGLHLTRELLEEGNHVAVFDLAGDALGPRPAESAEHLIFQRCDVTSEADVEAAVGAVQKAWGSIDVLVNNAC
ncbi:MAG: SDR family oxidoreductase [Bacillota bacterium]